MHRPLATCLIAGALLASTVLPAGAQTRGYQGTAGYNSFPANVTREQCLGTASDVMTRLGYILDPIGQGENALWAGQNGDLVLTTCITSRQLIVVFTHSPAGRDLRPVGQQLREAFGVASPAPQAQAPRPVQPTPQPQQPQGGPSKF